MFFAVSGVAITGTEVAVLAVGCVVAFVVSLAAIRFLRKFCFVPVKRCLLPQRAALQT